MNLVISHDAGAALILKSFFEKKKNTHFLLNGPAKKIFDKKNFLIKKKIKIKNYKKIFLGSSLNSKFEVGFLKKIKEYKIKTIVFFDSWLNFEKRLLLRKKLIFPDEIWVFDIHALKNAKKLFKNKLKIKIKKNYYLSYLIKKQKLITKKNNNLSILYLVGLVFKKKNNKYSKIELDCLRKFLKIYDNSIKKYNLIIRIHPNENLNSFRKILNVALISKNKLESDISKSGIIIGAQSMALYYSFLIKNKNTFCMLPKKKRIYKPTYDIKTFKRNILIK